MAKPSNCFLDLYVRNMSHSSVSSSLNRLMARLNRHHSEMNWFYGDFFKSVWLYTVLFILIN